MIDEVTGATTGDAHAAVGELLRFERLMAELSAGFINLHADRIDGAIDDGLRRIVETLGVDRSTLTSVSKATGAVTASHFYAVPGLDPVPKFPPSLHEEFPWALARARAGQPIVFARVDDLPAEASTDKANYVRFGVKSHVSIPIMVAGELQGGLGIGCVRRERAWPDALVGRMHLLAAVFANAIARKRAQEEISHAFAFEGLLANVSTSMLGSPAVDVERFIPQALRAIGEFLAVERVALWHSEPGAQSFSLLHYWSALGTPPALLQAADLPWISERILGGDVVRFSDLTELPPEANVDKLTLHAHGVRSQLVVPLSIDGTVANAMSLTALNAQRAWLDPLIPRVRLMGVALVGALERHRRMTELAEAHAESVQYRERLAHVVRVHTVGEMSAALAHEITQPLGAIENYAIAARRRALGEAPDIAKIVDLLDKAIGQATRAGDVVMRLRGLVKRHELDAKAIDLSRTIDTCVAMMRMDCELREIRLEVRADDHLPSVVADEIHLQQVVLNLLRNAMDALERKGPGVHSEICVELVSEAVGSVLVKVSDRGPGIAEGDLERVFESFYTTKPEGLGIGLALCRKLIEAHGGELWATHNPKGGAVFQFTLPVVISEG